MRKPIGPYDCQGGFDGDAWMKHTQRPFTHASTGRANWRRKTSKKQRREGKKQSKEDLE